MILAAAGLCLAGTQGVFAQQVLPGEPAVPPRPGAAIPQLPVPRPMVFASITELYRYVVQTRGLGGSADDDLVAAVEASSTSEQVPDASGNALTVVKADLLTDGRSRLRSASGNYPYYVLRRDRQGLVLLGVMFGDSYRTEVHDGRMEFTMSLRTSGGGTQPMRFRVEDDVLVNLSQPRGRDRFPFIADT